ncbi:MAG: hypothetical protein GXP63_00915, partial [DPANN group archaeon]|nr:hypothetical protein [DPANN group archaeon]
MVTGTPKRQLPKGNTSVSRHAAQANIRFIQEAMDNSRLLLAYLRLRQIYDASSVSFGRFPDLAEQADQIKQISLIEQIHEQLPKDDSGNPQVTQKTLEPLAEQGLLDDYLSETGIDAAVLSNHFIIQGNYSNRMSGHSIGNIAKRASKRTRQKYRPSLAAQQKGHGLFCSAAEDRSLEAEVSKYSRRPPVEQARPKIDWQNERRWRNKRHHQQV